MARIDPHSEYQRRLDAWARQMAKQDPDWDVPADACAIIEVEEPDNFGCDTCGYGGSDGGIVVYLANRVVARFGFGQLDEILRGIFAVRLEES